MNDKNHVLGSFKNIQSSLENSISILLAFMNKTSEENLKELELIGYGISHALGVSKGLQKYLKITENEDER